MDTDETRHIKKLAIMAMFSDDLLMRRLVLKGGNLLDIVYDVARRSSVDLDFSMETAFAGEELVDVTSRIVNALETTFRGEGYVAFDIRFSERPECPTPQMPEFWGGYRVEFKVVTAQQYERLKENRRALPMSALVLGAGDRKAFKIDISKFEFCGAKRPREIDGCTVYIYTPETVVFEKLRAVCQQMPEYAALTGMTSASARARDFFDIVTVMENFRLTLSAPEAVELLRHVFAAKRVPLALLGRIGAYREYHRPGFSAVVDTVRRETELKEYDYYFDYVIRNCVGPLEPVWNV